MGSSVLLTTNGICLGHSQVHSHSQVHPSWIAHLSITTGGRFSNAYTSCFCVVSSSGEASSQASQHLREAERGKLAGWGGSRWVGQAHTIQYTWRIQLPLAQCNLIDQQCCSVHILDINIQLIPGRLKTHEGLHYYEPSPTVQTHVHTASGTNTFCFCLYPAKERHSLGGSKKSSTGLTKCKFYN